MKDVELFVRCPYCGTENTHTFQNTRPHVMTCDMDGTDGQGGCDKMFVVRLVTHFDTTTKKIEGEEEKL